MAGDLPFEEILVIHGQDTGAAAAAPLGRPRALAPEPAGVADDVFVVGGDGRCYSAAWSPGNPWLGWWPMGR